MDRPSTVAGRTTEVLPSTSAALAATFAVAAVLTQISYPLLSGGPLRLATVGTVLLFAAASLLHATAALGPAAALRLLLVAGGTGLAAEAIGVATGVPFGSYRYSDSLGPALLGVPLLVPLAWTMMAYPALLLGRRLGGALATSGRRRALVVLTGAGTLAGWDLFLDPQMVAAGQWTWASPTSTLPGVPQVPLSNYAGWLLVAAVMILLLDLALPGPQHPARVTEAVPAALLTWTWLGSAAGNLIFFDRPSTACYGLVAMGAFMLPYLITLTGSAPAGSITARMARSALARLATRRAVGTPG